MSFQRTHRHFGAAPQLACDSVQQAQVLSFPKKGTRGRRGREPGVFTPSGMTALLARRWSSLEKNQVSISSCRDVLTLGQALKRWPRAPCRP